MPDDGRVRGEIDRARGAVRARNYRARQADGSRCAVVELDRDTLHALLIHGHLRSNEINDPVALRKAISRLFRAFVIAVTRDAKR